MPDRQALCGILFVLHTGVQREYLPQELGFSSGMTCWRRPAAWNEAGVRPGRTQGPKSGPSPVDRARPGSKHHVITDGQGIPLAVSLTGGNRNDVPQLLPLPDKIPPVAGAVGHSLRLRRRWWLAPVIGMPASVAGSYQHFDFSSLPRSARS